MNTLTKTFVGAGIAFVALFSLAFTFSTAKAADLLGGDWYVDYAEPVYSDYGGDWYVDYAEPVYSDYGYSSPSYSYPSFGGFGGSNLSFRSAIAPSMPSFAQQQMSTVVNSNTCTGNSCNTDNRYYDNSVFNAPTTVTIANTGDRDEGRRYDECYDCYPRHYPQPYRPGYQPPAYAQTPYISLSSTPYTGLELTPAQEVLYWSFLILWCLAIAYWVVYKRVLQKTVGFLNGFLFGSTVLTTSGSVLATSGPVAADGPAAPGGASTSASKPGAKAEMVEEGIDPFILSQIKR